jgi:hypothetical protein
VWRPKDKPDGSSHLAPTCMVCFLPNEFMAPPNQVVQEEALPDINEDELRTGAYEDRWMVTPSCDE